MCVSLVCISSLLVSIFGSEGGVGRRVGGGGVGLGIRMLESGGLCGNAISLDGRGSLAHPGLGIQRSSLSISSMISFMI